MPSQQLEANAFVTDHYGSMKTQAMEEHNGAQNGQAQTGNTKTTRIGSQSFIANHVNNINCHYCSTQKKAVKKGEKGPPQGTYLVQTVSCPLEPLTPPPPPKKKKKKKKPYMVASESPSHESSGPLSATKAEESVSESCLHFALRSA